MRHDHIVVTLDAADKSEIEAGLEGGETVEAWVADAVERKLAASSDEEVDGPAATESSAEEDGDDEAEGPYYEFVDDCAI